MQSPIAVKTMEHGHAVRVDVFACAAAAAGRLVRRFTPFVLVRALTLLALALSHLAVGALDATAAAIGSRRGHPRNAELLALGPHRRDRRGDRRPPAERLLERLGMHSRLRPPAPWPDGRARAGHRRLLPAPLCLLPAPRSGALGLRGFRRRGFLHCAFVDSLDRSGKTERSRTSHIVGSRLRRSRGYEVFHGVPDRAHGVLEPGA